MGREAPWPAWSAPCPSPGKPRLRGVRRGEGLQHHEAAEVLEGVIGDVPDLVESQGHGLQRWQVVQSSHRDLGQRVVVQPQVAQGEQPLKALLGHHGDKVCVQASEWERNMAWRNERSILHCFVSPRCYAKGVLMLRWMH